VGLYWVPGHGGVLRHIVGLYWVPGHGGVRRHIVGLYWVPGHGGVLRDIVGLYWVPGRAGVRRHIVGLYWVPGHGGVLRHIVGLYWVPGRAGVRRHIVGLYWVLGHGGVLRHIVGLYWIPGHGGVRGNELTDKLPRDSFVQMFVGREPFFGVSGQNIRGKIKRWVDNQQLARWRGLCSTQRQARKLISRPVLTAMTRFLSFNRTQPRAFRGLITGLRKHRHLMGLTSGPLCRRCGVEEETSAHSLCECEAVTSFRLASLWLHFLGPRGHEVLNLGAICNSGKGTGLS